MKKLIGTLAVAAAVLFAGYGLSTPASASTATPSAQTNVDKATGNTDISARHRGHYHHHRHYQRPHRWYRPRAYYRPYYAPRRHYGYGYGYRW